MGKLNSKQEVKCSLTEIPFTSKLSFELLIEEVQRLSKSKSHPFRLAAQEVIAELEKTPELMAPLTDTSLLEKHKGLVNKMMAFVINPMDESQILSVSEPMEMRPFYSNKAFKNHFQGEHLKFEMTNAIFSEHGMMALFYFAYMIILEKVYGFEIDKNELPIAFKLTNNKDKSVNYFNKTFNHKYIEVKNKGKHIPMSKKQIMDLIDHSHDLDYWDSVLPLKNFEFNGFLLSQYIKVTHDYLISELKSSLLDKNAITTRDGFGKVKETVRALVGIPDIEFGLGALSNGDSIQSQNFSWRTIVPNEESECSQYNCSVYEKAIQTSRILVTDDMRKIKDDRVAASFVKKGILSHAAIPLFLEDELIGIMELGSKEANGVSLFQVMRLVDLLPAFALALQRSNEEWNDRIRAIIQKKFTAIHPTVEWKFREGVAGLISSGKRDESGAIDPIVFPEIVPIYGASDVRASSIERNKAIQADLSEQLDRANVIILECMSKRDMPLLDTMNYKIAAHKKTVRQGLRAGDEVSIVEFLKREINPMFRILHERFDDMKESVNAYFELLDEELQIIYNKRKDFEDSLTIINNKVSEIVDDQQKGAQEIFPHYFEKYRTDGVEYNAYIGQSLVRDLTYDHVYLRSIRLWQLLLEVHIAREVRSLQPELKTKLDVAQLILVHSNPFSIEFRQDENKFDVAGAYNIRYEITKKRIDKALVKGTDDRLTQVGQIAIIYSHADEIEEYRGYINYMIAKGYLTNEVEDLELEDLKGASGLRALRVHVNYDHPESPTFDTNGAMANDEELEILLTQKQDES